MENTLETRPYLLLGESDHGFLLSRLAQALGAWGEEWLPKGAADIRLSAVPEASAVHWLVAETGVGRSAWLGCPAGWVSEAGTLMTAQPTDAGSASEAPELAAQVANAMLNGLLRQIFRSLSGTESKDPPRWTDDMPPDQWSVPGAGGLICKCALSQGFPLVIALSPALVAASLPDTRTGSASRGPLLAVTKAIEPCQVTVEAVVGETEIELEEISRLCVDDVVVLDRRLDDPLLLRLGVGDAVGRVHLGTTDGKKAVQVVGPARV